jgi:hypothetical protein
VTWFLVGGIATVAATAALSALAPLWLGRVGVLALAGPHNWMELRYLVSFAPGGSGMTRPFVVVGFAGTWVLAAALVALVCLGRELDPAHHRLALSCWHTALALWLMWMLRLRRARSAGAAWLPSALMAVVALAWLSPRAVHLALVYLHPVVALGFLHAAVRRWRPAWLPACRLLLAATALLALALALLLWDAGSLPLREPLASRSVDRAGAALLPGLSSHMLLSVHTFLETLHYGAWLVAIPIAGMRAPPWRLGRIPLASASARARVGLTAALVGGALAVVVLWLAFAASPVTTFDVYFTVAIVHVIAEFPCLLRLSAI